MDMSLQQNKLIVRALMASFPESFINAEGEFIAIRRCNGFFSLFNCKSENDVKCKVIENLSRDTFKSEPYATKKYNRIFHRYMSEGFCDYLGKQFTQDELQIIYQKLGNGVRHQLTVRFVESGCDMSVLTGKEAGNETS